MNSHLELPELHQEASLSRPGIHTPKSSHGSTGAMSEVQEIHPSRELGEEGVQAIWERKLHGINEEVAMCADSL